MRPAAFDKTFDLLLSYRRTDQRFALELARRLTQDFKVHVFIDEKGHEPGHKWLAFWREYLARKPQPDLDPRVGPGVLVLATDSIAEEKKGTDHVIREIDEAVEASSPDHLIPIYVLRFGNVGYPELIKRLAESRSKWDAAANHHPRT